MCRGISLIFRPLSAIITACVVVGPAMAEETGLTSVKESPIENLVNVSWGDQIMIAAGDAQLDTPDKIRRSMKTWQDNFEGKTILWRGSAYYIQRYYDRRVDAKSNFILSYYKKVQETQSQFDPLRVARQAARDNGQQFLIYMTVFDHGAPSSVLYGGTTPFPWQDRFVIENPQFQTIDRKGDYHHGVLEMAYPQSRRLMVERIKTFVEDFDTDGVYVCTRTHSLPALHADQFGFSPPVVKEFQDRHGVDILKDARFDYTSPEYDSDDAMVEKWRRLRGEYVVQFYRELREALPGKTIYTGIPRGRYAGPPYGNRHFDWESLVREQLVDGVVVGVYSSKGLHMPLYVPHATIGYLSSQDDGINIPSPEEAVANVYGPLCSEHHVKLFATGVYEPRQRRWQQAEPALNGFMINTPSGASQVVIEHDDALCGAGGALTVEAFVYLDRLPSKGDWARILSKYDHTDNNRHRGWEWIVLPDGRFRYRAYQTTPDSPGNGTDVTLDSPKPLPTRRWLHLATVYDEAKGSMGLYLDGHQIAERDINPYPLQVNDQQELFVGRYGGSDSHRIEGLIDELRIVSAAIEFTRVPTAPYTGSEANTVALYHMDQLDEQNRLRDSAPGHRHSAPVAFGRESMLRPSLPGFGQAISTSLRGE